MSQDYLDKLIEKDKAGTQIQSIPLHDTELRGITIDDPITVEGNPINFSTKNEQNAIRTVVDLEPIQDLHGYDKPWVGGAGKNLLPLTVEGIKARNSGMTWNGNSTIFNNVTFTILTDSDNNVIGIKVNGTAQNSNANLHLPISSINLSGHILNGCPSGGGTNTYYIRIEAPASTYFSDYGSGATITNNQAIVGCWIGVPVGGSVNNLIFKPMLRLSTESDATFEPYTNICPILPHEEIKIGGCRNNILPKDYELTDRNGITHSVNDDGTFILTGTTTSKPYYAYIRSINNPLPVEYGQNYVASFLKNGTLMPNISKVNARVVKVKNGVQGSTMNANNGIVSFTVDDSFDSIFIYINAEDTGIDMSGTYAIQLEVGTSNTTYEPYTLSNNLTLPLPEDIYGGTLNLETGELVISHKYKVLTDADIDSVSGGSSVDSLGGKRINTKLLDAKYVGNINMLSNIISNCLETASASTIYNINPNSYSVSVNDVGQITFRANGSDTVFKAQSYVSTNVIEICYELADSYKHTLHLTPSQLKLFKDVNNLNSSDYTTLTVTYHSNSIATLTPATDTTDGLLSAMDKHKLNTYDIADIGSDDGVTVEDNPLMITTRSDQHALSTKVSLAPIQDLHGYSKPWVGGAGKNLLPMTVDGIKSSNPSATWTGNSTVINGVTFTILTDSNGNVTGINANGTATGGNSRLYFPTMVISQESQFNGCASGGSGSTYRLEAYNNTEAVWIAQYGSSVTLSVGNYSAIAILVYNGVNVSNKIFYPMIRLATEPNPTFEPYTNICSISGLDEIDILGCGVNLAKPINDNADVNEIKYANQTDGKLKVSGTASAYSYSESNSFTLKSGSYIISKNKGDGNRTSLTIRYTSDGTAIAEVLGTEVVPFTLTSDTEVKIRVAVPSGKVVDSILEPMVRFASDADSTYEPYKQSNNLSLPLPETVYGGELDLESGELVVDKKITTLNDLSLSYIADYGGWFNANVKVETMNTNKPLVSSCYTYGGINNTNSQMAGLPDFSVIERSDGSGIYDRIRIKDSRYTDVNALLSELGNEQIIYPLATPYTIHLTPEQLTLFKDINHISTNAKSISVTYREGKLAINSPATDTKDGLLSAMDKRALDRTEEIVEGNPIQFETESVQVAKSTIVDLEPIQDLHGYSKPWVGGAGKNVLPSLTVSRIKELNTAGTWTNNVYEWRGITATLLTDSDNNITGIKTHGTASDRFRLFLCNTNDTDYSKFNNYILSGCPSGGNASTYYILIQKNSDPWTNYAQDVGSGATIVNIPDLSQIQFFIQIHANIQVTNLIWYPMIRAASASATFAPYTNICPISGRTEIGILGCGVNLFDGILESGAIDDTTGQKFPLANRYRSPNYIPVKPNTNYAFSKNGVLQANNIYLYKKDKTYIRKVGYVSTFLTSNETAYVLFYNDDVINVESGLQLEEGTTATPYTPYQQSNNISIQLDNTVYGGTLDVEKGELVVDKAIVDLGDLSWTKGNTSVTGKYRFYASISNNKESNKTTPRSISSHYSLVESYATYTNLQDGYVLGSDNKIYMYLEAYSDYNESDFATAMSGVQLCYELSTPTTINLTPEQVKLLSGVNTITTNADKITLTYRNGSVATLNDLESLYNKLKAYIDSLHSS